MKSQSKTGTRKPRTADLTPLAGRLRVEKFQKPLFLPTCLASIPRVADSKWGQKMTHLLSPFAVSSLSRLFWILLSMISGLSPWIGLQQTEGW